MPSSTSQSSESQASPRAPISPFSSFVSASDSHYTSDDLPDLGAFNTVLREWTYLQPPLRIPQYHAQQSTASGSTVLTEPTGIETEGTGRRSTVWAHQPIAQYLASESDAASDADAGETDTEGGLSVEIETVIDDDIDGRTTPLEQTSVSSLQPGSFNLSSLQTQPSLGDLSAKGPELEEIDLEFQPSLGYLDEALGFIAAERARLDAQRTAGGTASPDAWKHVIDHRRRRRRKRPGKGQSLISPTKKPTLLSVSDNELQGGNHTTYVTFADKIEDSEGNDENDNSLYYGERSIILSKSTPMTPRPRVPSPAISVKIVSISSDSNDLSTSATTPSGKIKSSRKRSRPKHSSKQKRILTRARSTSSLHTLAEAQSSLYPPKSEIVADLDTQRLVALARYLGHVCPTEHALLMGVEKKLVSASKAKWRRDVAGFGVEDVSDPELNLDPRGRAPRADDPPVHVFIDHSNILFGLLTYLKRHPPPTLRNTRGFRIIQSTQTIAHHYPTATTGITPIPLPSFATAARSLRPNTTNTREEMLTPHTLDSASRENESSKSNSQPKAAHGSKSVFDITSSSNPVTAPIPIPISVSTSSTSDDILLLGKTRDLLASGGGGGGGGDKGGGKNVESSASNGRYHTEYLADDDKEEEQGDGATQSRRPARHLSHTALSLILERGRPVTRRVVVTSSPLYQPMDILERLGYEVRVYMRVPDLGDGMDRKERHNPKNSSIGGNRSVNRSPKKSKGHSRRLSGNTSPDSAGASTSPSTSFRENEMRSTRSAAPPVSSSSLPQPSTSALVASITPPSYNDVIASTPPADLASPSTNQPLYYLPRQQPLQSQHQNSPLGTPGAMRIRYREQGVDELLQLKLHQALAATDDVPEGATIVLATGDGNVGQFNEDGFLGPVRTALKRGWRVELYAWEDGLSRAWRREFGVGSEWARNGRFQIIGMEQFAASLVKDGFL